MTNMSLPSPFEMQLTSSEKQRGSSLISRYCLLCEIFAHK